MQHGDHRSHSVDPGHDLDRITDNRVAANDFQTGEHIVCQSMLLDERILYTEDIEGFLARPAQ